MLASSVPKVKRDKKEEKENPQGGQHLFDILGKAQKKKQNGEKV